MSATAFKRLKRRIGSHFYECQKSSTKGREDRLLSFSVFQTHCRTNFFPFVCVAAWQRCGATASAPKSTTRNPMCHCLFGFPHYCFRFFPVSLFETLSIKIIMKAITTTCLCVQFTFAQSERVCTRAHVQYPRLFSTLFLSLCTMSSCVVCAECICRWTIVCVCVRASVRKRLTSVWGKSDLGSHTVHFIRNNYICKT